MGKEGRDRDGDGIMKACIFRGRVKTYLYLVMGERWKSFLLSTTYFCGKGFLVF